MRHIYKGDMHDRFEFINPYLVNFSKIQRAEIITRLCQYI